MEIVKVTCYTIRSFIWRPHYLSNEKIVRGLVDKSEDHIEGVHQDSKRNERIYCVNKFSTISKFSIEK